LAALFPDNPFAEISLTLSFFFLATWLHAQTVVELIEVRAVLSTQRLLPVIQVFSESQKKFFFTNFSWINLIERQETDNQCDKHENLTIT
jgi:hypothetical protein